MGATLKARRMRPSRVGVVVLFAALPLFAAAPCCGAGTLQPQLPRAAPAFDAAPRLWPHTVGVPAVPPRGHAPQVHRTNARGGDAASRGLRWRPLVLGSLGVIVTGFADREIRLELQRHGGSGVRSTGIRISRWSPPLALGIGAGLLGAGLGTQETVLVRTGRDALVAMGLAGFLTVAAKVVVGRARPTTERGTHHFEPLRFTTSYNSFPSGHTSQAFALAAAIAAHTRLRAVRFGMYGAAGIVGIARVAADRHFASDVVAGAILGTVVGRGVVHHFGGDPGRVALSPTWLPGQLGLALRVSF